MFSMVIDGGRMIEDLSLDCNNIINDNEAGIFICTGIKTIPVNDEKQDIGKILKF